MLYVNASSLIKELRRPTRVSSPTYHGEVEHLHDPESEGEVDDDHEQQHEQQGVQTPLPPAEDADLVAPDVEVRVRLALAFAHDGCPCSWWSQDLE